MTTMMRGIIVVSRTVGIAVLGIWRTLRVMTT
jgi:hypothetical protein